MSKMAGVHGIGNHQRGRHQLLATWTPALSDGLERATGRRVPPPELDIGFYGDLFLPGSEIVTAKGAGDDEALLADLDGTESAELIAVAAEALRPEDLELAEREVDKGYTRTPRPLQVVLRALDRRFGAAAGVLYIGVLRQVRRYLDEPALRVRVAARVSEAVAPGCRVVIGHSLGSIVAYDYVRQHRDHTVELLLTVGSPLGLRMVRDRLTVDALDVSSWVNLHDVHDPVACAGQLSSWWPQVEDVPVDNGGDAHAAERYLSKKATGQAVLKVLPELAP